MANAPFTTTSNTQGLLPLATIVVNTTPGGVKITAKVVAYNHLSDGQVEYLLQELGQEARYSCPVANVRAAVSYPNGSDWFCESCGAVRGTATCGCI